MTTNTGIERCISRVRAAGLLKADENIVIAEIELFRRALEQRNIGVARASIETVTDALGRHGLDDCCELLGLEYLALCEEPRLINPALVNLAIWRMSSDLEAAQAAATSALAGFTASQDENGIARAAMVLGDVCARQHDFSGAKIHYAHALSFADASQRLPILWRRIEAALREYMYGKVPELAELLPTATEVGSSDSPKALVFRAIRSVPLLIAKGVAVSPLLADVKTFCTLTDLDFESLVKEVEGER